VAAKAITPSHGPAARKPSEDFLTVARPLPLSYTDFSCSVVPRFPLPFSTTRHCSVFERIIHPYNSDAFDSLLLKHGLSSSYPLLSQNLRHGFPLGHMPALTESVILPNNPSTYPYMRDIDDYLQKELLAGRMSGPFSREEAELILRGPFFSSPLIVDVQPQQPGMPDKIRICRHLSMGSKLHPSVNSHIRKEDFPTRFDLASKVAEIVSFPFSVPSAHFLHVCCTPLCVSCVGCFLLCCRMQFEIFAFLTRYLGHLSLFLLRNLCFPHDWTHLVLLHALWTLCPFCASRLFYAQSALAFSLDVSSLLRVSWIFFFSLFFSILPTHHRPLTHMGVVHGLYFIINFLNRSSLLTLGMCFVLIHNTTDCSCPSRHSSLYLGYRQIPSDLPRLSSSQTMARCSRPPWPVPDRSCAPFWCSLCQQQCWHDCQCRC
jgi:hypothetical protein